MTGRWAWVAVAATTLCSGCLSTQTGVSGGDGDCTSRYQPVAHASTWPGLREAMLTDRTWGRVVSLRTQAHGVDVGGGDHKAVRVVDLLDRRGRRLAQVDVWRTDQGGWRAGVWSQCID
jgi:hypothetical protein